MLFGKLCYMLYNIIMIISSKWITVLVLHTVISIQGTLMASKITIQPNVTDVLENGTVTFNCTYTGDVHRLIWKKTDVNICIFAHECLEFNPARFTCKCDKDSMNNKAVLTLEISNITSADHNTSWTCWSYSNDDDMGSAVLLVQVPVKTIYITPAQAVIQISENSSFELTCKTSYSRPVPVVWWRVTTQTDIESSWNFTGNQTKLTTTHGLTSVINTFNYSPDRSFNGRMISCVAKSQNQKAEVKSALVKLNVTYPPEPYLKINDFFDQRNYSVIEGNYGMLTCSIEGGNPQPVLTWDCYNSGNKTILTDKTLRTTHIRWKARRHTDRSCTCYSTQKERNNTLMVVVEILYPPSLPQLKMGSSNVTGNVSVILNSSLLLNCVSESAPSAKYTWKFDSMTTSSEQMLNIIKVEKANQGQYTCIAKNTMVSTDNTTKHGSSNVTIGLQVLYAPTIDPIGDQTALEGSEYNISCPVNLGNPVETKFNWTANDNTRQWLYKVLSFSNVSRDDDMVYTCTVYNTMLATGHEPVQGQSSEHFHLNVEYAATVDAFYVYGYQRHENITVNETDYVNFICNVKSNPTSTAYIKFQGENDITKNDTNNLNYTIGPVVCLDAGVYMCTGHNKHNKGHASRLQLFLFVTCPPKANPLVPLKENITSAQNIPAVLNFSALAHPAPTSVVWQKYNNCTWKNLTSNNDITISQSELNFSLTINNVLETDFGQYKLVIVNEINSHEQIFNINAEDKPDPPTGFSVIEELVTGSTITVQWYPSFDGGKTQHFILNYSKIGQDWSSVIIPDSGGNLTKFTVDGLSSGSMYRLVIHAENSIGRSGQSVTLHVQTEVLPTEEVEISITGIAAGSAFGVIVISLGIFLAIWIYRKRHGKTTEKSVYQNVPVSGRSTKLKKKTRTPVTKETRFECLQEIDDVPQVQSERTEYYNSLDKIEKIDRIKVQELFQYVLGKDEDEFAIEYQKLPTELQKPCIFARKPENIALNRYNGIFPYDHSRVKIHDEPNFFINACYIDGYGRCNAYIASLGPTAKTTRDYETFWQMVWHERSDIIVMLTNLREPSGMKCEQYWPGAEGTLYYGDICVTCQKTDIFAEYTVRTFTITKDEERRYLTHLHYTAWPDKTVPEDVTSLIEFRQRMKSAPTTSKGPIVVHCSAGIGRTGTLIALDRLIEEGQDTGSVNVFECVNSMREQRVKMVQTLEQYIYIYKALVNSLTFDGEAIPIETFEEYVETTNNNMYSRLFQQLRQSVETDIKEELEARSKNENLTNKNRHGADIPGNRFRVFLFISRENEESDYVNAVYMNSFKKKDFFIVAQTPLPSTTADFIGMVYQEDCSCVVSMDDLNESATSVGKYFPDDKKVLIFGNFKVTCSVLDTNQQYVLRRLKLTYEGKFDSGEKSVFHFQYTKWMPGNDTPANAREFVQFVNEVEEYGNELGGDRSHVLVHCLNANERSGLFCAVSVLLEKLKLEHQVSVSNTLRHCRTRRRSAITSMEQLRFCYQAASAYTKIRA